MAQGKRFYKKNNRQAGAPGENQEATVAGSDNTPKGRIPADSSDKTAGGNPNQKDGRKWGNILSFIISSIKFFFYKNQQKTY